MATLFQQMLLFNWNDDIPLYWEEYVLDHTNDAQPEILSAVM